MMSSFVLMAGLALAAPAATQTGAQTADWDHAQRIEIALQNYRFDPAKITMRHGEPYVLAFVNKTGGGHNFVAKQFFAAANVLDADRPRVAKGDVSLEGGEAAEIHIIAPAAGTYEAHCSHFMHASFGMKGSVVVE